MRTLSIIRPDDWHVHLRDGEVLSATVNATASHFKRALIMPNLQPPLTTIAAIQAYYSRILAACTTQANFQPYMTFYLNEAVKPEELISAKQHPEILGAKLYPAGVTTNSAQGAKSIRELYPQFEAMQQSDLVLQIHGEVIHGDIFERETLFIESELKTLIKNFPKLRIVLEHISTHTAVDFILKAPAHVVATITPHHLLYNRNQLLTGGIRPHYYCLPILKHAKDQLALQQAAVSGSSKFFAGTDSAPHAKSQKESPCGCAGIYSAPYALAMYAQLFDQLNALDKLEAFMSQHGAIFYQLPISTEQIELVEQTQQIPVQLPFGSNFVVPLAAGESISWSVHES